MGKSEFQYFPSNISSWEEDGLIKVRKELLEALNHDEKYKQIIYELLKATFLGKIQVSQMMDVFLEQNISEMEIDDVSEIPQPASTVVSPPISEKERKGGHVEGKRLSEEEGQKDAIEERDIKKKSITRESEKRQQKKEHQTPQYSKKINQNIMLRRNINLMSQIMINAIWLLDIEMEQIEKKENLLEILKNMLNELIYFGIVRELDVKLSTDPSFLIKTGLVSQNFNSKFVSEKTKKLYTQEKYNLYREESEGYAKLFTELCTNNTQEQSIETTKYNIHCLIGYFDLDPNRVLDVILESYELHLDNANFLKLLSDFNKEHIYHILGFKFVYYHENKQATPHSLCTLTAILIKNKLFALEDIYAHLSPSNKQMQDSYESFYVSEIEAAKTMGSISIVSNESITDTSKIIDEDIPSTHVNNQKFSLLIALLEQKSFDDAIKLFKVLEDVHPEINLDIIKAICDALHHLLDPIYSKNCPQNHLGASQNSSDGDVLTNDDVRQLEDRIFPLFVYVGLEIHRDVVLFTKIVRVVKVFFEKVQNYNNYHLVLETILYGMTFVSNFGLNSEIWDIFKMLPFELRFEIYGSIKDHGNTSNYKLMAKCNVARMEAKGILKKLAKDNAKMKGRSLAKISHSNPIVVCDSILDVAESYDSLIPIIIDSLKYVTPLLHDVMIFCILERLVLFGREKIKSDGVSTANWLQNLATYVGMTYKKYQQFIDLEPIIKFILFKIRESGWEDMIILRELIKQMGGIEITEDLGPSHLEAHAGGDTLRAQAGGFSSPIITKQTRRSIHKLRDTLVQTDARNLILLLAKLKNSSPYLHSEKELPSSYLKLVIECHDKCHESLLVTLRFLQENTIFISDTVPSSSIGDVGNGRIVRVPSIGQMHKFGIEPECIFALIRPAINSRASIQTEIEDVSPLLPSNVWKYLTRDLYSLFWTMDLYDLYVPVTTYQSEIKNLEEKQNQKDLQQKKKEQYAGVVKKLEKELKIQNENHDKVLKHIQSIKDTLCHKEGAKEVIWLFLQYCIIPRCLFSPTDALYCARFSELLHSLNTPYFSSLQLYTRIIEFSLSSLLCCSEAEAQRYGRFLDVILATARRWLKKENFEKECAGNPCFALNISDIYSKSISHSQWCRAHSNSHQMLTDTILQLLKKEDLTYSRNCLIVLNRIADSYPYYISHAKTLESTVKALTMHELESVKIFAKRYHALLSNSMSKLTEDIAPPKSAKSAKPSLISSTPNHTTNNDTTEAKGSATHPPTPPATPATTTNPKTPISPPRPPPLQTQLPEESSSSEAATIITTSATSTSSSSSSSSSNGSKRRDESKRPSRDRQEKDGKQEQHPKERISNRDESDKKSSRRSIERQPKSPGKVLSSDRHYSSSSFHESSDRHESRSASKRDRDSHDKDKRERDSKRRRGESYESRRSKDQKEHYREHRRSHAESSSGGSSSNHGSSRHHHREYKHDSLQETSSRQRSREKMLATPSGSQNPPPPKERSSRGSTPKSSSSSRKSEQPPPPPKQPPPPEQPPPPQQPPPPPKERSSYNGTPKSSSSRKSEQPPPPPKERASRSSTPKSSSTSRKSEQLLPPPPPPEQPPPPQQPRPPPPQTQPPPIHHPPPPSSSKPDSERKESKRRKINRESFVKLEE